MDIFRFVPEKSVRDIELASFTLWVRVCQTPEVRAFLKTTSDIKQAQCPTYNSHLLLGHTCRAKGSVM